MNEQNCSIDTVELRASRLKLDQVPGMYVKSYSD